jgi:hypothetical protein
LGDGDVEKIEEGWCSCVGVETPSVFGRKEPRLLPPCLLFFGKTSILAGPAILYKTPRTLI